MAISAQDVNKLRQITGAGMMDCKVALTEADGDFEEAITILRKKGQKVSEKRAGKEATEGQVFLYINEEATEGVGIALNCETDFVAKNEEFVMLGKNILNTAVASKPTTIDELKALHVEGKSIGEHIVDLIGKIGEKVDVSVYEIVKGEKVATYLHSNTKLGVLVALNGTEGNDVSELAKDLTLQIASMKPIAIDKDGVDASIVEKEIEIGKEQARQEGKPEAMLEKIALGKLNKFYQENTLLSQAYVKDNSKTIAQLIQETGKSIVVASFKRIAIG